MEESGSKKGKKRKSREGGKERLKRSRVEEGGVSEEEVAPEASFSADPDVSLAKRKSRRERKKVEVRCHDDFILNNCLKETPNI